MIFKAVVIALALILAYLFALNGRYDELGDSQIYFDKWGKKLLIIEKEKRIY